jgi:hypothetical protein
MKTTEIIEISAESLHSLFTELESAKSMRDYYNKRATELDKQLKEKDKEVKEKQLIIDDFNQSILISKTFKESKKELEDLLS